MVVIAVVPRVGISNLEVRSQTASDRVGIPLFKFHELL